MKKFAKKLILTFFSFILTGYLLMYPKESFYYASTGLSLWFERMIPTLLPFMILSGIMVRLNLTEGFARIAAPICKPLFKMQENGIYAIIIGFICGFPMGARVIGQLYACNKLTKQEATYLLSFCNNIGPIYFIGFVLPTIGLTNPWPYVFGMYGIPLIYGMIMRRSIYKEIAPFSLHQKAFAASNKKLPSETFLDALDDSISNSLMAIAKLGGYMIVFNLLNLFFHKAIVLHPLLPLVTNCMLEITSGISRAGTSVPIMVLLLLPFGGFSCIAQTYSMIKETDLSLSTYIIHKLILSLFTVVYYIVFFLIIKPILP